MKIAFDISPLSSAHKVRGTGFYVQNLKNAFEKYFSKDHEFIFFEQKDTIPKSVDIIHYPYFDPFFLTLPWFENRKTVVTVHDLTPLVLPNLFPIGLKGKMKWFLQKQLLKRVTGIVTDSHSSKTDIAKIVHYPKERIFPIYLAPAEHFKQIENKDILRFIQKKYKLPDVFALYVGDVTANKNVVRIMQASLGAHVPIVMVGKTLVSDNYDKNNLWNNELQNAQGIAKNNESIIRLGFVNDQDLVRLYNLATVCLAPSLYEGFGLPVVEAMASGCPIITSKNSSLAEIAGDACFFVNPYSVEDMTRGIQKVIGDKKLQKNLTQKGLHQAKEFSWEKTASETIAAYKKTVGI